MSADEMGWPDKDRPGVPLNPEVDGWHVLLSKRHPECGASCWFWEADQGGEGLGGWQEEGGAGAPDEFARDFTYVSPIRTDVDLRAASAASFKAGVEAAAAHMRLRGETYDSTAGIAKRYQDQTEVERVCAAMKSEAFDGARSIRAIPIPDASALDAALERARQEEREACATLCELWRHRHPTDIAAAIRARSTAGREGGG